MKDFNPAEDHTVFIPAAQGEDFGGLASVASTESVTLKSMLTEPADQNILLALDLNYRSGINRLIECATEIFFVHYQIMKGRFNDARQIRVFVQDALLKFELRGQQEALPKNVVKSAKYVLCTFLDEAILQTEWGRDSDWGRHTLLAQFFNETWGGKTVFKIRQFCLENIHEYIDLLEMIYLCLCLGFRGQYGTEPNGEVLLGRMKRETYQAIADYRGERANAPLSPQGASTYQATTVLKQAKSLKWIIAACAGVIVVAYVSMSLFVSLDSQPVYEKAMSLVRGQ